MGRAGSHTLKRGWDGQVFFTQSLMTWEGASETDVFLIGEPWVRERGFCANSNMTFQTAKTSTVEQRNHWRKQTFFRERKKITSECTNNANGDKTACIIKGSRVLRSPFLKTDTDNSPMSVILRLKSLVASDNFHAWNVMCSLSIHTDKNKKVNTKTSPSLHNRFLYKV